MAGIDQNVDMYDNEQVDNSFSNFMRSILNDKRKRQSDIEMRIVKSKKLRMTLLKQRRNLRDRIKKATMDLKAKEFDISANERIYQQLVKDLTEAEPVDDDANFM